MTPAVRALEAAGVAFTTHSFDHDPVSRDPAHRDWGRVAAAALGVQPDQVFKTLVVVADDKPAVAIVPVSCQLSLKAVGAALGTKRVEMGDLRPRSSFPQRNLVKSGRIPLWKTFTRRKRRLKSTASEPGGAAWLCSGHEREQCDT